MERRLLARFESLESKSPLYARAIAMPGFAYSDHFTNASVHYAWSAGHKAFLESFRRMNAIITGGGLSVSWRRFPSAVRIERFREIAGLDKLMCDAEVVARKSYQRGLGVGFENSLLMRRRLEFESRKGWLRGYILYIEDRPCAFWIGSLRDGTFYSDFLGYDPDRAEYSPGMYLVINVLEELFGPKIPPLLWILEEVKATGKLS